MCSTGSTSCYRCPMCSDEVCVHKECHSRGGRGSGQTEHLLKRSQLTHKCDILLLSSSLSRSFAVWLFTSDRPRHSSAVVLSRPTYCSYDCGCHNTCLLRSELLAAAEIYIWGPPTLITTWTHWCLTLTSILFWTQEAAETMKSCEKVPARDTV